MTHSPSHLALRPSSHHTRSFHRSSTDHQPPMKRAKLNDDKDDHNNSSPLLTSGTGKLSFRTRNTRCLPIEQASPKKQSQLSHWFRPATTPVPPVITRPGQNSLQHKPVLVVGGGGVEQGTSGDSGSNTQEMEPNIDVNEKIILGKVDANGYNIKTKHDDNGNIDHNNVISGGEKRSLRSHDSGSRSRSDLMMYFPNYEQVINLEPVKQEFLSPDTRVSIINDLTEPLEPAASHAGKLQQKQAAVRAIINCHLPAQGPIQTSAGPRPTQIIDFTSFESTGMHFNGADPLGDGTYFKSHRRLERQEKRLRNIEKERAQHDKSQLERILNELQGHEWPRVMGIGGITDSEKSLYQPKREYFIREVSAILEKLRVWKEEEKRRKYEKGQLLLANDEDDGHTDIEKQSDEGEGVQEQAGRLPTKDTDTNDQLAEDTAGGDQGNGPPADLSDVDAWAAHQLHQEALSASQNKRLKFCSEPKPNIDGDEAQSQPHQSHITSSQSTLAQAHKPFTSFYSKNHLREIAVKKNKRGRLRTAFGVELPPISDEDFRLPDNILNPESIRACQRRNRRLRRENGKATRT